MQKRVLLVGLIVAVMAVMTGCDPEAETGGGGPGTDPGDDPVDEPVAGYAATAEALEEAMAAGKSPIAVVGNFSLGSVTIPANMRVELYSALTLNAGATLAVAGELVVHHAATVGSLALTAGGSGGAKITGTGKVKAGKTEIVGGAAGWQAVGDSGTVTIAVPLETTATITAADTAVLTAQGAGATITQLAGEGNGLTIAANTEINLKTGGSLVLTGAASHGAKLVGAGKVVAGGTEITGGADNGWQAVGTGTIAIEVDAITGSAGAVLTATAASANGIIAVTAPASTAATLTVTTASIDITTGGKVTLTGNDSGSVTATLVLKGAAENAASLIVDTSQMNQVDTVGSVRLDAVDSGGSANPAEVKINNMSITATPSTVVILAGAANLSGSASEYGKLGGGTTPVTTDLWIVSSKATNSATNIVKGGKLLATS
ncbi:MAG: hypothetical protein LBK61_06115 [Spirochaetaceae bacterium]|jgi:hypothetical protein|nr:hypothetical protein [Spirochaetaceae bacterium]